MPAISNDDKKSLIWNLDTSGKSKGPYLVVQTGYVPGDQTMTEQQFVLRPDGFWADFNIYLSSPGLGLLNEVVFKSLADVLKLFSSLGPDPKIAPERCSAEALSRMIAANPQVRQGLLGLQKWVLEHRARS